MKRVRGRISPRQNFPTLNLLLVVTPNADRRRWSVSGSAYRHFPSLSLLGHSSSRMAQRCGLVTQQIIDLGTFLAAPRVDWRVVSVLAEYIARYSHRGADEGNCPNEHEVPSWLPEAR